MNIQHERVFSDGSGWEALVVVRGVMFSARHVAGRVSSGMGNYKYPPRMPKWVGGYVQKWAEKRVAELPAEYHEAHRKVYELGAA
jgi:hypothetical protein